MKKIFLHGGYFSRNFGDYLLIKKTIDTIKLTGNKVQFGLPLAPKSVKREFPDDTLSLADIRKVDMVIFTGGGYLGQRDYKILKWSILCLYRQVLLPVLCLFFRKKYGYFGVEVGPLKYTFLRSLIGFCLNRAQVVVVRNIESYDFCKKNFKIKRLVLGTDFAQNKNYLENFSIKTSHDFSQKTIGVHVTKYDSVYNEHKMKLVELISNLRGRGYKIVFFTDSPAHDELLLDDRFLLSNSYSEGDTFIGYQGPESTAFILRNFRGVITTKLHVGIVNFTAGGVPFSLPSHNKTVRYYRQIGYPNLCLYPEVGNDIDKSILDFSNYLDGTKELNFPSSTKADEYELSECIKRFFIGD